METSPPSPRVQSAAVLVPLAGLFLLMPPFVFLFAGPRTALGIPLIVLYLFGAWAVLIVITWQLSRRLAPPDAQAAPPADGPPPA